MTIFDKFKTAISREPEPRAVIDVKSEVLEVDPVANTTRLRTTVRVVDNPRWLAQQREYPWTRWGNGRRGNGGDK